MKADKTLDCFGLLCPMPIVKTAMEFKKMRIGETLEILATDQGIKSDMPAWCEATGNKFLGLEEAEGEYKVYVKKIKEVP
ncbi:MAG: sulfurtransferase TusA family protein [Candidatus Margulisbacteria bacterium]|nr:sulfurtransferase TusA family protein [Candidatus Margulisiibacteriota bacterium]